jgi:hypothetical protein
MRFQISLLISFLSILYSQSPLEIGMRVPHWVLSDANEKEYTMDSWPNQILQINYVDPDESDMNEEFNDKVKKAIDVDSLINRDSFRGIGIADCASSWKPDFLIRAIGGRKAEKFDTTVLFDYEAVLRKSWKLQKDSYNIIILDRDRIVRGLYKGKMSEVDMEQALQLIIALQ